MTGDPWIPLIPTDPVSITAYVVFVVILYVSKRRQRPL